MIKTIILAGSLVLMAVCTQAKNLQLSNADQLEDPKSVLKIEPVSQARVKAIATMLPQQPKGLGEPCKDRKVWDKILKSGRFKNVIATADKTMMEPLPALTDEIYMSFFNSNNSELSKRLIMKRRTLLTGMVWAECLQNTGKYIPAIEAAIIDIINQKSWNFPAEDRKLTNFNGTQYTINLSPADNAHTLAQTSYLLGDKLSVVVRQKIKDALYLRVFNPTLQAIETKNKNDEFGSLTNTGNHNAVTLAGVTGAALSIIADRTERAVFVAIAERYAQNSIIGFLNDGYCTEGLGYFNYGFSHYSLLRELIWQATASKIDLFDFPKVKKIALYVPHSEIINDVYPAIGDCDPNMKPDQYLMNYLSRNLNLGLKKYEKSGIDGSVHGPLSNVMYFFPNSATLASGSDTESPLIGIRSYFNDAGVITVRPETASPFRMGATLKGGNNNEKHNHNDVGSFTIVVGKELLMGDPGLAVYTSKTFSSDRYTIKTLTSYGHPVPVLASKLQSTGENAAAKITTNFGTKEDRVTMDLTSAYAVPQLNKYNRSFNYNRTEQGYLEVKDEVEFSTAQSFETALITRGKWKQLNANTFEITGVNETLIVDIDVPDNSFSVVSEVITEPKEPFTRIGIRVNNPIQSGTIMMKFRVGPTK